MFAIVGLLLLRSPQTPGELKARSGRLHTFTDNAAVVDALAGLIEREGDPLAVKLPRARGRKYAEYMHLFFGPIDVGAHAIQAQAAMIRPKQHSHQPAAFGRGCVKSR